MSHIVTAKSKINMKNLPLLQKCVQEAGGTWLGSGTHGLWGSNSAEGFAFRPQEWGYPVVVRPDGSLLYDSMDVWKMQKLQDILNRYAVAGIIQTAQQNGFSEIQQTENKDEIVLVLNQY